MAHAVRVPSIRSYRSVIVMAPVLTGLFSLGASVALADTIHSTAAGGAWDSGPTWIGGVVPAPGDDVILDGPVAVRGSETCANLEVAASGALTNGVIIPSTLEVTSSIVNAGAITDGVQVLRIRVGGDLDNQAVWTPVETTIIGISEMHLSQSPSAVFESHLSRDGAATGDLLVDTPFTMIGNIDLRGGRTILSPDCPLTVQQGSLSGDFLCQGNEIRFESWSYLIYCDLDAAVLVGDVDAAALVSFTGGVTVMDGLSNSPSFGNSHVTIDGPLINYGVIQNDSYGFTMGLTGDLECYGEIRNSLIEFQGSTEHHLRMGPEGNVDTDLFLPEFGTGTIIVDTNARISDGVGLGLGGTMVLVPGITLDLTGGSISGGTLWAQGNDINMSGSGSLSLTRADQTVLHGTAQVSNGTAFTGGLHLLGVLQNWEFAPSTITVAGDLINDGHFRDNVNTLTVHAQGNVINRGLWENRRVVIDGSEDQTVEIGDGIGALEFVLVAGFSSSIYQWYRDDAPLPGEISSELLFTPLDASDSGSYRCEGGEGQVSRTIVIGEGVVTDAPELETASVLRLAPVRPNPIGAGSAVGAEIGFVLPVAGAARLVVYDVVGREVSVLLSERLSAGGHVATWTPEGISPGVYFVRLTTPTGAAVRKVTLVE